MGTNYCDLKMLLCGSKDGCKPVTNDYTTGPETTEKFSSASVDMSACLKVLDQPARVPTKASAPVETVVLDKVPRTPPAACGPLRAARCVRRAACDARRCARGAACDSLRDPLRATRCCLRAIQHAPLPIAHDRLSWQVLELPAKLAFAPSKMHADMTTTLEDSPCCKVMDPPCEVVGGASLRRAPEVTGGGRWAVTSQWRGACLGASRRLSPEMPLPPPTWIDLR